MQKATFNVGDTIRVYTKDLSDQKLSKTPFEGIVIALRGQKENQTFTVRRNASAHVSVERIFPLDSPSIESVKVVKKGDVRRAKLYHLRKTHDSARS
ncbi:50S ribosomal protein L19 [Candidatus Curtissbacteria bacterium]|nr:50S ribosomal protein L19 [Candidatus Curtissbacteria bacterium]